MRSKGKCYSLNNLIYAWNFSYQFTHDRSIPWVEKLATGARLQLQTFSKGHVYIDMNFPSAVTKYMEEQRWKYY